MDRQRIAQHQEPRHEKGGDPRDPIESNEDQNGMPAENNHGPGNDQPEANEANEANEPNANDTNEAPDQTFPNDDPDPPERPIRRWWGR